MVGATMSAHLFQTKHTSHPVFRKQHAPLGKHSTVGLYLLT